MLPSINSSANPYNISAASTPSKGIFEWPDMYPTLSQDEVDQLPPTDTSSDLSFSGSNTNSVNELGDASEVIELLHAAHLAIIYGDGEPRPEISPPPTSIPKLPKFNKL